MAWLEVRIKTQPTFAEAIGEFLSDEADALAVTFHDPEDCDGTDLSQAIFEPEKGQMPLWQQVEIVGLFADTAQIDFEWLKNALSDFEVADSAINISTLQEQDWSQAWTAYFKPMLFADRLWIYAEGQTIALEEQQVALQLNPGLAFGTGTHATTAMCLQWLAELGHLQSGDTVIDYGCGSGILGLSALKLGAGFVHGVDIDEQALEAMAHNAEVNQISSTAYALSLPQDNKLKPASADVLAANILANPLVALAAEFKKLIKPQGFVVLSGILAEQVARVQTAYQQQGFSLQARQTQEEWACLVFKLVSDSSR